MAECKANALGRLNKIASRVTAGIFSDGRESQAEIAAERPAPG
jgi:hypothetical protein